jgi:hypothetical protein
MDEGDCQFDAPRVSVLTKTCQMEPDAGLYNVAKTRNPFLAEIRAPGHWYTG